MRILRSFFRRIESYPDLLSADDFYAPIHAFLDTRLAERGFVRTKRNRWVGQEWAAARPMFELWHFKGKSSAPVWGFALNFVPHLNNSRTRLHWHRTVKSARLDVFPFDELEQLPSLTRFADPDDHAIAVKDVLGDALDRAAEFFGEFRSTRDLLPLFERLRRYKSDGLGYWNYTNMPLAHAFTLRVNGDYAAGRALLDEYVGRMRVSEPATSELVKRLERATAGTSLR